MRLARSTKKTQVVFILTDAAGVQFVLFECFLKGRQQSG